MKMLIFRSLSGCWQVDPQVRKTVKATFPDPMFSVTLQPGSGTLADMSSIVVRKSGGEAFTLAEIWSAKIIESQYKEIQLAFNSHKDKHIFRDPYGNSVGYGTIY